MRYASVSTMPDQNSEGWPDPKQLLLFAPREATWDALVALFATGIIMITLGYGFFIARQDSGQAINARMDQWVQFDRPRGEITTSARFTEIVRFAPSGNEPRLMGIGR